MTDLEARLRDQETWAAEHGGRSEVFWSEQQKFNTATTDAMEELTDRLTKLDKRIIYVIGFGSGAGLLASGLGATIARVFLS